MTERNFLKMIERNFLKMNERNFLKMKFLRQYGIYKKLYFCLSVLLANFS